MIEPIKVFIDTNIFDGLHYDFSEDTRILHLTKLINENKVKLLISDVVIGEVKSHIKKNIENFMSALSKVLKKPLKDQGYESWNTGSQAMKILRNTDKHSLLNTINLALRNKDEMLTTALLQFDNFISNNNVEVIDSNGIDVTSILTDYFEFNLPFEKKKDKRNEFPDAFMMAKIKKYAKEHGAVCVVSNDNSFNSISSKNITIFKELKDFLHFVNPFEEWNQKIISYFTIDTKENISKLIHDKILDTNPHVDGREDERTGSWGLDYDETYITKVCNIHSQFLSVNNIDDDNLFVELKCQARIYAECTFFDDSSSIWDPEDKVYAYRSSATAKEVHKVEFEAIVEITIDEDKNELRSIKGIDFEIELDHYSRISRKIFSDDSYRNEPINSYLNDL